MTPRRIVLGVLLIIPLAMIISVLIWPEVNSSLELIYLVVGVPILVLNAWEWTEPEMSEWLFGKKEKQ